MRDLIEIQREIDNATKDLALLNINYMKEKEAIDNYISDREEELKQKDEKLYYAQ